MHSYFKYDTIFTSDLYGVYNGSYRSSAHITSITYRISSFNSIKEMVFAHTQPLRKWGWLEPAGGLLTTIDDIAKVCYIIFI